MREQDCYSEYALERLYLGLMDADERVDAEAHIGLGKAASEATCLRCRRHFDEIANAWQVPEALGRDIPERMASQRVFGWLRMASLAVGAVACVALVLFVPGLSAQQAVSPQQISPPRKHPIVVRRAVPRRLVKRVLIKGTGALPKLVVAREWKGEVQPAFSGGLFRVGMRLRLAYQWAGGGHVVVLHRDANGVLSPLYPAARDGQSIALPKAKALLLPGSLLVEGKAEGNEEIVSCYHRRATTAVVVLEALQRGSYQKTCELVQRFILKRR